MALVGQNLNVTFRAFAWVRVLIPIGGGNYFTGPWQGGNPDRGLGGFDLTRAGTNKRGFSPIVQGTGDGTVQCNFGQTDFKGKPPQGFQLGWPNQAGGVTQFDTANAFGSAVTGGGLAVSFPTVAGVMPTTPPGLIGGNYYFEATITANDIFSTWLGCGVGCWETNQDGNFWFNGERAATQNFAGITLGNPSAGIYTGRLFLFGNELTNGGGVNGNQLNVSLNNVICWAVSLRPEFSIVPAQFFPVSLACNPCCSPVCDTTTTLPPI